MALERLLRPGRSLFSSYKTAIKQRPWTVQLTSGTGLVLLGDLIAQKLIERNEKYDVKRAGIMVVLRGLFHSSVIIAWYKLLNAKLPMPGTSTGRRALTHLFFDQAFFGPANVIFFFAASGVLEGKSEAQIKEKLSDRGLATVTSAWCLWVPFQAIMFRFVPAADQRLIMGQTVAIFWNGYMSYCNSNKSKALQAQEGRITDIEDRAAIAGQ